MLWKILYEGIVQKYLNNWPWRFKAKAGSALVCPPGFTTVFAPHHPSGDILKYQQTVPLK